MILWSSDKLELCFITQSTVGNTLPGPFHSMSDPFSLCYISSTPTLTGMTCPHPSDLQSLIRTLLARLDLYLPFNLSPGLPLTMTILSLTHSSWRIKNFFLHRISFLLWTPLEMLDFGLLWKLLMLEEISFALWDGHGPIGSGEECYGLSIKCTSHVHALAFVSPTGSTIQQISHGTFGI